MKSYTDIEQSKKLAEILPLESADYHYIAQGEKSYFYPYSLSIDAVKTYDEEIKYVPCWSLAALLDVLPLGIDTHKQTDGCKMYYYVELYTKRMRKEIYLSTERYENLVDACYEMFTRLNTLNLLGL